MGWDFYLFNDGEDPIELAVLYEIGYEWGNLRASDTVDVRIEDLAPGQCAFVCSGDGSAEAREELMFRMRVKGREARLSFEFPKLYKLTDEHLRPIKGLKKPGFQVAAEAVAG